MSAENSENILTSFWSSAALAKALMCNA